MSYYLLIMNTISILGILLLAITFYLIVFAPSKLNLISQVAIHGHEISVGICQTFITIGLVPTIEFPCPAAYGSGLLTRLELMSILNQGLLAVALLFLMGWFVTLISLIRVFAIKTNLSEKLKKRILWSHVVHLAFQMCFFTYAASTVENAGSTGLEDCLKMTTHVLSPHMYSDHVFYIPITNNKIVYVMIINIIFIAILFAAISIICGTQLIKSLRSKDKHYHSLKHSKAHRDLTSAILYLIIIEGFGISVPTAWVVVCVLGQIGEPIHSNVSFIVISLYPIVGCILIWMATPVYKEKLIQIVKIGLPKALQSKISVPIRVHNMFTVQKTATITTIRNN